MCVGQEQKRPMPQSVKPSVLDPMPSRYDGPEGFGHDINPIARMLMEAQAQYGGGR